MRNRCSHLLVLPLLLTFACGEPAGAKQTVDGALSPKKPSAKIDPAAANKIDPTAAKKIVAPDMIAPDVKRPTSNALIGEDGKALIGEDGKALIGEDGKALIGETGSKLK